MLFITFNNIEDENKFYYVYKKYNRLIYKYISDILNNHQDCEDAIQKTWFKISVNIGKIKNVNEKTKVGYMHRIAENTAIDYVRKNRVYNIEIDEIHLKNSYNDIYKFIEMADFKEAILSLSDEYRSI